MVEKEKKIKTEKKIKNAKVNRRKDNNDEPPLTLVCYTIVCYVMLRKDNIDETPLTLDCPKSRFAK